MKKSDNEMRELGKMIDAFLAEHDLNDMAEEFFRKQAAEETEPQQQNDKPA